MHHVQPHASYAAAAALESRYLPLLSESEAESRWKGGWRVSSCRFGTYVLLKWDRTDDSAELSVKP